MSKHDASAEEAAMVMQVLQAQGAMQSLVLEGYLWSHKQCTSSSTLPQLSAKEKRCIQQGMATYLDVRSHIAQTLAAASSAQGHDF